MRKESENGCQNQVFNLTQLKKLPLPNLLQSQRRLQPATCKFPEKFYFQGKLLSRDSKLRLTFDKTERSSLFRHSLLSASTMEASVGVALWFLLEVAT